MSSNEYEISLLITDDETIRKYNKEYRNKDRATDVLSFPMEDDIILGDVAISFETAKMFALQEKILKKLVDYGTVS